MVDLVRAGVIEVFALEVDLRAAKLRGQALGMEDRAGTADVVGEQGGQLLLEIGALADFLIGGVDIDHGLLELWRHQLAAIGAEVAVGVRHGGEAGGSTHRAVSSKGGNEDEPSSAQHGQQGSDRHGPEGERRR
ncbi:hypothetical protein D9M71_192610 [compost metagenome]